MTLGPRSQQPSPPKTSLSSPHSLPPLRHPAELCVGITCRLHPWSTIICKHSLQLPFIVLFFFFFPCFFGPLPILFLSPFFGNTTQKHIAAVIGITSFSVHQTSRWIYYWLRMELVQKIESTPRLGLPSISGSILSWMDDVVGMSCR